MMAPKVEKGSTAPLVNWVITALGTIITAGMSFWLTHMAAQVDTIRAEQSAKSDRLSKVEAYVSSSDQRLDRIESKLDIVLQRSAQR